MAIIINKNTLPPKEQKKREQKKAVDHKSMTQLRKELEMQQKFAESAVSGNPVQADYPTVNEIFDITPKKSQTLNYAPAEARKHHDKKDHEVVINGQVKKLGKHSHYLIDMLTTE